MAERIDPARVLLQPPLYTILADMREQHQHFAAMAERLQRPPAPPRQPGQEHG